MQSIAGRAISIASSNGELAVVLDDGQWFLVNPDARQGPYLPDEVKMIAVANDDQDNLWSLGIQTAAATTEPTTFPASTTVSATVPSTFPSTAPSTKPAPERLIAYRLDSGKWVDSTVLPTIVSSNPAKISMIVIDTRPIVAWLADDDQTIQVIQLGSDHVWSLPKIIHAPQRLDDFKLLAVEGKPALWLLNAVKDSKNPSSSPFSGGELYRGDSFSNKISLAAFPNPPASGLPETLALAFNCLQLVAASDGGFFVQAYDLKGRSVAPVTRFTKQGPAPIEFGAWIAGSILVLLIALVAGLAQRRSGAAINLPLPPHGRIQLAPLGRRFGAGVVDLVPLFACYAMRQAVVENSMLVIDWPTMILVGLCLFTYILHTLIAEVLCGQSVGKMLFNLRVVGPDGKAATPRALAVRNLLRVIDVVIIFPLPLLAVLFTPLHQRFGDLAVGTVVVSNEPESEEQPAEPE
jgi:uncharacterized RDD family membrane protein YckC